MISFCLSLGLTPSSHMGASDFGLYAIIILQLIIILLLAVFLYKSNKHNKELVYKQSQLIEEFKSVKNEHLINEMFQQLEKLIENMPLAFAIICDEILVKCNDYCQNELGIVEETLMRNYYENPELHDKVSRSIKTQDFILGETAFFTMKNGEVHRHLTNYLHTNQKGQNIYMMFATDIESIEYQKESLKRSQEDLQKIIDVLPCLMAVVDIDTNILEYGNNLFLQAFNFQSVEQARTLNMQDLVEQFYGYWQGKTVTFDYVAYFFNEEATNLKIYADQIIYQGKNCIVLIGQNISDEIRQKEMLSRAAEKEKEANSLKGMFLANMSHEIRTPMNAIIGLSQLALMKEQTPENTDFFYKISSSAKNLLSIINDILDFSKIEAEKMDFIEEEFAIEETITNAFLVATERLEGKELEILLDIEPEVPCYLYGDKTRLWQVLKNLLDNSVKYSHKGHIILSVNITEQDFQNIILTFHVKDSGIGMSKDQLLRIFVPFEQFHRKDSKATGTGLGMSITKQLVELMHGTIHVESQLNVGTDFYVTIPFRRSENKSTIIDLAQETIGRGVESIGPVLIADDDECALSIMSSLLTNVGIETVCVSCGKDAILTANEYADKGLPFKIIILDYILRDIDGLTVASKIDTSASGTKLLLVTSYLRRVISEAKIKKAGFKDIIEKPFVVSTFVQKVCSVIPKKFKLLEGTIPRFSNARVLLCEDNEINQIVAEGLLESFDIIPEIVENGNDALELLEKNQFDLILMDIVMPIMDGHETTKRIRQSDKPYKNTPIIAMSANAMSDEIEVCFNEGMNGHVEKPIDIKKLKDALLKFLVRTN